MMNEGIMKKGWAMLAGLLAMLIVGCGSSPVFAQQVTTIEGGGQVGWINGSPIRTRIRVGADGETYVGVWVQAPNQVPAQQMRAPMAVSLVVDTSGSMAGDKIQNARMAAASLLESLADGDIVSVYGFSNAVTEIAAPTVVSQATRPSLMTSVNNLYAMGGTNMYDGLQVGVQRLAQAPTSHPLRRIFLISDGHANIGPSDPGSLGTLGARATEWGTQITGIGVGLDYDQSTLSALAVSSSGRLYHLAQPQQMAQILQNEVSLLSRSVAVNAMLEVRPAPGVIILDGATTGATVEQGVLRMPLGSVFAGQEREILFRARVNTAQLGARPLAQARLVYQAPGQGGATAQRTETASIGYEVIRDAHVADASRAPRVEAMVANYQATRAQLQAAEMMRSGNTEGAAVQLESARRQLEVAASAAPSAPSSARLRERAQRFEGQSQRARATSAGSAGAAAAAYDFADEAMEAEGY